MTAELLRAGRDTELLVRALPRTLSLQGAPIAVRFLLAPRACGGRLLSGGTRGEEVHAGAFLRQRLLVLDAALREDRRELRRILVHELHHFVWLRLGNQRRASWAELLRAERGRGELGWSAAWRLAALSAADRDTASRRWREYACESFCDTAAWVHADSRTHPEWTLSQRLATRRQRWWQALPPVLTV